MKNIAVILAAGSGTRVGGSVPKQFLPLADGKTVLETCVDAFEQNGRIDEIIIVTLPDYIAKVQESMLLCGWQKVADIILGGKERWESSWNTIQHLHNDEVRMSIGCNLLFHDCARPFVSQRIITDVCRALEQHEAVSVAVPATDTIYECSVRDAQCTIHDIPDRTTMYRAQTPQAFRFDLIREAFEKALAQPPMLATDDCGIVFRYMPEVPVHIVAGEETNRKITFPEDLKYEGY